MTQTFSPFRCDEGKPSNFLEIDWNTELILKLHILVAGIFAHANAQFIMAKLQSEHGSRFARRATSDFSHLNHRTLKETSDNGVILLRHKTVPDVETAIKLIENVSIWHGSTPNPWTRSLLENFSLTDGTWLEHRKEGQLVGCGAILRDNKFQLTSSLGLEDDVPGGYFLLLYAALQDAFEHKIRLVRFGSGAYDVKRRLRLHLEDTNHAMITMAGIMSRAAKRLASED